MLGAFAGNAMAEVVDKNASGFTLVHEVSVATSRAEAWRAAVGRVGEWWNDDHTVSGDAANMRIDAIPQGCFCESIGGQGGVVHLTVTFVNPGVLLRMTGGLGPLGLMGVNGNMTWEFFDADDATRIRFTYAVGGYYPDGLDALAEAVDGVIGDALERLREHIDRY